MFPDIEKLREERPELDEELLCMEADAAERFHRFGPDEHCAGVYIAHEGVWALESSPPGTTAFQCSLGSGCAGRKLLHGDSNRSCRLLLAPCPACDGGPA